MKIVYFIISLLIIFIIMEASCLGLESKVLDEDKAKIVKGTLNLILINDEEIVAATDSRATYLDGTHEDNSQKLFKITDKIGCTIAGFASGSLTNDPRLGISAAGIINHYKKELKIKNYTPSIDEATKQLLFELEKFFRNYTNSLLVTGNLFAGQSFNFALTVFGFENKRPEARQIYLTMKINGKKTYFERIDNPISNLPSFKIYFAGAPDVTLSVLNNPFPYSDLPVVKKYALQEKFDVADMKDLITFLMKETSKREKVVGGPIQLAVLKNEKIVEWNQKEFPEPPSPLIFSVANATVFKGVNELPGGASINMNNCIIEGDSIYLGGGTGSFILVNSVIEDSVIDLDGNYFTGSRIDNCICHYNGGPIGLDFNKNSVINSVLLIKEDAVKLPNTDYLMNNFKWKNIGIKSGIGPLR